MLFYVNFFIITYNWVIISDVCSSETFILIVKLVIENYKAADCYQGFISSLTVYKWLRAWLSQVYNMVVKRYIGITK